MSYPPPHDPTKYPDAVYHGEPGLTDVSTLRRDGAPPDIEYKTGGSADYLATGILTNGQFGLYRWNMAAEPTGPSPHFHRGISESFYVLDGTVRLYDGTKWIDGRPGDFLFVPEGGVHGFRNESGEPASMLILFAPGAPREGYFEGLDRVARGEVMTEEQRTEFMLRHDTFWVDES